MSTASLKLSLYHNYVQHTARVKGLSCPSFLLAAGRLPPASAASIANLLCADQVVAMAAALVESCLPTQLPADISTFVGLAALQGQSSEEFFAPYCGKWIKDKDASDSMTACCQLLGFSTLLQHAVRLIKGLDIQMQQGIVSVSVCSFISWFKITERYPIDGSEVKNSRRDMRSGGMLTTLKGEGKKAFLRMHWGGNYAGGGEDELYMPNPDELHIITKIWVDGDPNSPKQARQVYRRA